MFIFARQNHRRPIAGNPFTETEFEARDSYIIDLVTNLTQLRMDNHQTSRVRTL